MGTEWNRAQPYQGCGRGFESLRPLQIVPETNRANGNAPSHRVYVDRAEIGAAWSKSSNEGRRDYLSVKLDDPSFKRADLRQPLRRRGR